MAATTAKQHLAEDRLTKLPSEVLHLIFDYLFCRHQPDRAFFELDGPSMKDRELSECGHTLDFLAATSRILRAEVNDWAIHFMTTHEKITKFKMPKTTFRNSSNMIQLDYL